MAIPNEIQTGRLNSILHKLLDMKEGAPAPTLAPDVFAMIALEVDRPEWKFLSGERLAMGARQVAAGGAGTYGNVVLWNPVNSGVLVIVEEIWNWTGSTRSLSVSVTSTDVSGTYSAVSYRGLRDTRFGTGAQSKPSALIYSLATAAPTSTNTLTQMSLTNGQREPLELVLGEGTGLSLADTSANETFYMGIRWRERGLLPSETR